jgi:hypothetical protein
LRSASALTCDLAARQPIDIGRRGKISCALVSTREPNNEFSEWLRARMASRGYPSDGPRSGGLTRLSRDSGVSMSVISRALNEGRRPEPDSLIKLVRPLRTSLRELLIRAGHATAEDLPEDAGQVEVADLLAEDPTLSPESREHIVNQYRILQRYSAGGPHDDGTTAGDDEVGFTVRRRGGHGATGTNGR